MSQSDSNTTSDAAVTPTTDAPAPFNKPTADLILRSSDGMNFRVRKAILAEASPVFEDMLSLPTPQDPAESPNNLPIVPMTEDSRILQGLLCLCYPINDMPIQTLEEASILLDAARKYAMDGALNYLGQRLVVFADTAPVRVYALAIRYQLREEIVRAAAKASLNVVLANNILATLEDLTHISASAFLRLLDYRDRCAAAAVRSFDDLTWIDASKWCFFNCSGSCIGLSVAPCTFRDGLASYRGKWWTGMMTRCRAIVLKTPCGAALASQDCTALALTQAGQCNVCTARAPHEVGSFMLLLVAEVDKAVSEVKLAIV
ncbi:uncharacterized protein B0H18DRAFT_1046655 [Fomitopsis serialis]|uniref:uncharacterized protein n=1 Tax=Fomitopsis serialis TaxID=139415 RepID=UPI002008455D|nr:uncharacterized protein B0H18DRAFT_1046655 [Neoantrodia serialis]KAH9914114.1 hypothetical protein B0H18DRAFT_1046655 [Neoantrodia serialis]